MSSEGKERDWAQLRAQLSQLSSEPVLADDPLRAASILEERARLLARPIASHANAPDISVIVFSVHGERYAIELAFVRETVRSNGTTRVPGTPDWFVGVESLRGEMVAVVDLGRLLGVPSVARHDAPTWLIVIGEQESEFALCCNEIAEVVALPLAQIVPPPTAATADGKGDIRGLTQDAIVVLDAAALLADARLFVEQDEVIEV